MKKISIVVPIYNSEKYLKECINSLINQTYKNIEIILINDGSTDESLKICKEYQKKDIRIKIINKKNEGQGKARNIGIDKASGHYIIFVDSDDWIDLTMLEKMYSKSKMGKVDLIICSLYEITDNKVKILDYYNNFTSDKKINLIISEPGPVCKLIKTSLLKENKLYFLEKKIYEDLAWAPILGIICKTLKYVDEPLYFYRIHSKSTMRFNKNTIDIFDVIKELHSRFKLYDKKNKHFKELEFLYISHLLYGASLRFIKYKQYDLVKKNIKIINEKYPDWKKNKYLIQKSMKFKIVIKMIYHKFFFPLRVFILLRNKT